MKPALQRQDNRPPYGSFKRPANVRLEPEQPSKERFRIKLTPLALMTFASEEVNLLVTASEMHYDGECKRASVDGIISKIKRIHAAHSAYEFELTFRELDTMTKCLERVSALGLFERLRSALEALAAADLATLNPVPLPHIQALGQIDSMTRVLKGVLDGGLEGPSSDTIKLAQEVLDKTPGLC